MVDIRRKVEDAVDSVRGLPSVFVVLSRGTEVSLVKGLYVIHVGNWLVNTTSGEWKATTTHRRRLSDGGVLEITVRGQGPKEILRSVATALAMGVFDG